MEDIPEIIRQRMEATKSQLTEKLESLELQVSESVQTTGTAVSATAVAVQDAVQSVSDAFDIRLQMEKHPWLILGGSVVLGYLAVEFLEGPAKKTRPRRDPAPLPPPASTPVAQNGVHTNGKAAAESVAHAAAMMANQQASLESSPWHQLQTATINALIGAVQDVAARAVPQVMDYLNRNSVNPEATKSPNPVAPKVQLNHTAGSI